jgi:RNA polymerase sigma-70 factor, ECF subfamily
MDGRTQAGFADVEAERLVHEAYLAHAAPLQRYLCSMVRDLAVAEDLTQEAFLRLAREVQARRTPDNVPGWLFRVGANLVASRARHAAVVARTADPLPPPDGGSSPEAAVLDGERSAALRLALAQLSDDHRKALVLAAHGYRGPEIASQLGRSQLATRALLFRARNRMRTQLVAAGVEP